MMEAVGIRPDKDGHEAPPAATLESLMDLSTTVLEEAQGSTRTMTSRDMLAAADRLDHVSRRMRELAGVNVAPPCPEHTPHDADRSPSADRRERGARILLADDLDLNRKLIADMLSLEGHAVDCVVDGAEAVRAVEVRRYDLVLMDMVMPGMDGVAATRAIRALTGPARDVPIVALTANAFREQLNSCLEAGMNAVISKPMTIDTLTTAVAQWTRGRDAAA